VRELNRRHEPLRPRPLDLVPAVAQRHRGADR
ncbi:unknown, partial [Pseudomonas aeruginosa]